MSVVLNYNGINQYTLMDTPWVPTSDFEINLNAVAFDKRLNHFDVELKAMFGSDIGHWDVPDMTTCVPDAYQMVENGLMNEENFRDFMLTNPAEFFTSQNPDFFKGTTLEGYKI